MPLSKILRSREFFIGVTLLAIGAAGGGPRFYIAGGALILGALTAPDIPDAIPELSQTGRTVTVRDSIAPRNVIYGNTRVAGVMTYINVSGKNNKYFNAIYTLSGHEIESINKYFIGSEEIAIDGSGYVVSSSTTGAKYAGLIRIIARLGTPNQAYISELAAHSRAEWFTGGLRFNGAGDSAVSAAVAALTSSAFTVEVRFRARNTEPATIMSAKDGTGWELRWNSDKSVTFEDSNGNTVSTAPDSVVLGDWTAIAVTGEVGSGPLKIYLDGVLEDTGANYERLAGSHAIRVGSKTATAGFFQCDMDFARYWNVVRSAADLLSHKDFEFDPPPINLVAQWKFDDGSGGTAADSATFFYSAYDLTLSATWTPDHRQRGCAHVYVQYKWDENVFPNGVPSITFQVSGRKIADPRTAQDVASVLLETSGDRLQVTGHGKLADDEIFFFSEDSRAVPPGGMSFRRYWVIDPGVDDFQVSDEGPGGAPISISSVGSGAFQIMDVEFSDNSALCVADYLTDTEYGVDVEWYNIDVTKLNVAANVCDESVALLSGGTEKRYTCVGVFLVDRSHKSVLELLLSSMAGSLVYVGDRVAIYAGAYITPTITLSESHVMGRMRISTNPSISGSFNAVRGTLLDSASNYETTDYPPVLNSSYEASDGERHWLELQLPFTDSIARAQRLAKIALERGRQGMTVRASFALEAYKLIPGETVFFDNVALGWSGKPFEVLTTQLVTNEDEDGRAYGCDVTLRETAAGIFDWDSGEETEGDLAPNTGLPNPFLVFPPENMILSSGTADLDVRLDGTIFSRIHVTWDLPDDAFVEFGGHFELQHKKSSSDTWLPSFIIAGDVAEAFILDVQDGVSYDVRIRAANSIGTKSIWHTIESHIVIGKTAPPDDVLSFKAFQNGTNPIAVTFEWSSTEEVDLAGFTIKYGKVEDAWEDANFLTKVTRGTRVTSAAVPPSPIGLDAVREAWRFFVKANDTSENESVNALTYDLIVEPEYDELFRNNQEPAWLGVLTNYVVNKTTGHLNPASQSLADGDDFDVFEALIQDPFATSSYESSELDVTADDDCRTWAELILRSSLDSLVPTNAQVEFDFRLSAGSYDGFEPLTFQQETARFFKHKFIADNSVPATVLSFVPVIDVIEHVETATVTLGTGDIVDGLLVSFLFPFRVVFSVVATSDDGEPSFHGITEDGFRVWLLDVASGTSGEVIGGDVTYTARGL